MSNVRWMDLWWLIVIGRWVGRWEPGWVYLAGKQTGRRAYNLPEYNQLHEWGDLILDFKPFIHLSIYLCFLIIGWINGIQGPYQPWQVHSGYLLWWKCCWNDCIRKPPTRADLFQRHALPDDWHRSVQKPGIYRIWQSETTMTANHLIMMWKKWENRTGRE